MAHTPGPWKSGKWKAPPSADLSEGIDIWATDEDGGKTLPFAVCKHIDQEANARLIAAAPDLLEALQLAHKALEAIANEMTVGERYTNAGQYLLDSLEPSRAAIAKATGEQQ